MKKEVIPGKNRAEIKKEKEKLAEQEDLEKKPNNGSWSKLLSKVFGVDISKCREYGGEMRVTSSIVRVDVIQKILTHLGLSPQPPPVAPACSRQLFLVWHSKESEHCYVCTFGESEIGGEMRHE